MSQSDATLAMREAIQQGVNRARMQPPLTCITLDAQIMAGVADCVRLILDNGKALALFQAQQN